MSRFDDTRFIAGPVVGAVSYLSTQLFAKDSIDSMLVDDLHHVAAQRIFFGHQSVGGNLLDGVAQLAAKAGVFIKVQESSTAKEVGPGVMGHIRIGENGNPTGKLDAFNLALGKVPTGLHIAVLKFCYIDFTPATDVKALFSSYRNTVESIRARNPGLTVVHVTVPLTNIQRGPKAFIKILLGQAPYGVLENLRRKEYNTLVRQVYSGHEPIFDLARFESTNPDGARTMTKWKNVTVPFISSTYTSDGCHLNELGRLGAARELISVLAKIQ